MGRPKQTLSEFIDKSRKVHGDKYDYSQVEYINNTTPVKIICPIHGSFMKEPAHHYLHSSGCPQCTVKSGYERKKRGAYKSTEWFIKMAQEVHGDKYDYSQVEYLGAKIKVKIICSDHGVFEQSVHSHLRGSGCPKCHTVSSKSDISDWVTRANRVHKSVYDYSSSVYTGAHALIDIVCPKHGVFTQVANNHVKGAGCPKCAGFRTELSLLNWCNSLGFKVISHDRKEIGLELDVFFPGQRLAVELNGLYWHSFLYKSKDYHYVKWQACQNKNIDLIQFWDIEWNQKREICQSIIQNRLGLSQHIGARLTVVQDIGRDEACAFLDVNHIQGRVDCKWYVGLKYNDKLFAMLAITPSRFDKSYDYEIVRHVNLAGWSVSGGFSKMLSYFRALHPGSIVDYCDMRLFNGNGHYKLGFKMLEMSKPDLHYTDGDRLFTRSKYHGKSGYASTKDKYAALARMGIYRIYGVGKKKFVLEDV